MSTLHAEPLVVYVHSTRFNIAWLAVMGAQPSYVCLWLGSCRSFSFFHFLFFPKRRRGFARDKNFPIRRVNSHI